MFRKELVDALRDRRTLLTVLLSSVALGPLVLVLVSTLVSGVERVPRRAQGLVQGMARRRRCATTWSARPTPREAPADYERR